MNDIIQLPMMRDEQKEIDHKTIDEMLRRARKAGVERPVVLAFGANRLLGLDVSESAWKACEEHNI